MLLADRATVELGADALVEGARALAGSFAGRARVAKTALINGAFGAVWAVEGEPRVVFDFTVVGDRIAAIDLIGHPETLDTLDLEIL